MSIETLRGSVTHRTYSGESIEVLGETDVTVSYEQQQAQLPLIVVRGTGPSLFGRNWLAKIRVNWESIYKVHADDALAKVLTTHKKVFEEGLGKLKGYTAKIHVIRELHPAFVRPDPFPMP